MTDTTVSMVFTVLVMAWFVLFWGVLRAPFSRRVRPYLEALPQIMIVALGALVAALDAMAAGIWGRSDDYSLMAWLYQAPLGSVALWLVLVVLSVKGQRVREAKERVPVIAFVGASGGSLGAPRKRSWRDRVNGVLEGAAFRRIAVRGGVMLGCAVAVLVLRGDARDIHHLAYFPVMTLFLAALGWTHDRRGMQDEEWP